MTYEDFRDVCAIAAMKAIISTKRRVTDEECADEAFGHVSAMLKRRAVFVDAERQEIEMRRHNSLIETADEIWLALRRKGPRSCLRRVDLSNLVEGGRLNDKQQAISHLMSSGRIRIVHEGMQHWFEAVYPSGAVPRDPGGGVP